MALEYCPCIFEIKNSFYSRSWSIPSCSTKHILSFHGSFLLDSNGSFELGPAAVLQTSNVDEDCH